MAANKKRPASPRGKTGMVVVMTAQNADRDAVSMGPAGRQPEKTTSGQDIRRGVGRPPGDPEKRRRRVLSTRVTDTELGMCMGAAEAHGESLGDWLRRVAMRSAAR